MTLRAFLAVPLTSDLQEAVRRAQTALRDALKLDASRDVRLTWVQPDVAHLTLKFLGDIDERLVDPLRARVDEALASSAPVALPLGVLGGYPRLDAPRTLWLGPPESWLGTDDARRLLAMQAAVERAAVDAGAAPDPKPWRPHLTLARVRRGERLVGRALRSAGILDSGSNLPPFDVSEVVLMRSQLTPRGPVHTRVWATPLPPPPA